MTSLTGSVITILFFFTNRLIFSPVKKIRIEAGRLELDMSHESLTDIIQEVIDALKAEAVKRQLIIDFDPKKDFEARVDRYRIYQVISNLMDNAIKFSKDCLPVNCHVSLFHGGAPLVFAAALLQTAN